MINIIRPIYKILVQTWTVPELSRSLAQDGSPTAWHCHDDRYITGLEGLPGGAENNNTFKNGSTRIYFIYTCIFDLI